MTPEPSKSEEQELRCFLAKEQPPFILMFLLLQSDVKSIFRYSFQALQSDTFLKRLLPFKLHDPLPAPAMKACSCAAR